LARLVVTDLWRVGCLCNLFVSLSCFFSVSALAQSNYAELVGSVADPQHHSISGADVRLTAASTLAERHVFSNSQGFFEIPVYCPTSIR